MRNADAYANSHDYGNTNTDCDAEAAETYADAKASSHTGASPGSVEN